MAPQINIVNPHLSVADNFKTRYERFRKDLVSKLRQLTGNPFVSCRLEGWHTFSAPLRNDVTFVFRNFPLFGKRHLQISQYPTSYPMSGQVDCEAYTEAGKQALEAVSSQPDAEEKYGLTELTFI